MSSPTSRHPVGRVDPAGRTGVTVHDPGRCLEGYTLFCESYEDPALTKDGKGKVYLIDMEGRPVHRWYVETALQSFCRLLPDGNLLYPTRDRSRIERAGLRELDPGSNVVWYYHCRIDHDCQVLADGNLMLHTITDYPWPELGPELKRHPRLIEITRDKGLVWEWRGEEHLGELEELLPAEGWRHLQERARGEFSFDWAHNNTCQTIPPNATFEKEKASGGPARQVGSGGCPDDAARQVGSDGCPDGAARQVGSEGCPDDAARFRPGNIVFSYRSVDVIGVIDRETGRIVWAWGPGELDGQHKPHVLENGNVLIFDNGTLRGYSRVIELDPLTEKIEWEYVAEPKESFRSPYISGAQRLANGNTLICEGGKARLFEVTPGKEIVWEFVNPFHEEGGLGSVYRCLRYSPEYVRPLLDAIG